MTKRKSTKWVLNPNFWEDLDRDIVQHWIEVNNPPVVRFKNKYGAGRTEIRFSVTAEEMLNG